MNSVSFVFVFGCSKFCHSFEQELPTSRLMHSAYSCSYVLNFLQLFFRTFL